MTRPRKKTVKTKSLAAVEKDIEKLKKQQAERETKPESPRDRLIFDLACRITSGSDLSIQNHDLEKLDDVVLEALDKAIGPAGLARSLKRLADAAETYMTSDPEMHSHADTERELEQSIEEARMLIKEGEDNS